MATKGSRTLLVLALALTVGACENNEAGRGAKNSTDGNEDRMVTAATEEAPDHAAPPKTIVVDVDRPFMKWPEARPDVGRPRLRNDSTNGWTDAKVIDSKVPATTQTAPHIRETIPKTIEPGSRIGSVPPIPEPPEALK
jgi:hypothetical protein